MTDQASWGSDHWRAAVQGPPCTCGREPGHWEEHPAAGVRAPTPAAFPPVSRHKCPSRPRAFVQDGRSPPPPSGPSPRGGSVPRARRRSPGFRPPPRRRRRHFRLAFGRAGVSRRRGSRLCGSWCRGFLRVEPRPRRGMPARGAAQVSARSSLRARPPGAAAAERARGP